MARKSKGRQGFVQALQPRVQLGHRGTRSASGAWIAGSGGNMNATPGTPMWGVGLLLGLTAPTSYANAVIVESPRLMPTGGLAPTVQSYRVNRIDYSVAFTEVLPAGTEYTGEFDAYLGIFLGIWNAGTALYDSQSPVDPPSASEPNWLMLTTKRMKAEPSFIAGGPQTLGEILVAEFSGSVVPNLPLNSGEALILAVGLCASNGAPEGDNGCIVVPKVRIHVSQASA